MHSYFRNLLDRKDMTFFTAVGDKAFSKTYAEYFNDISDCLENIKSCCSDIKGKHIGILADNSYEYLVVFGALFMGEAFVVPINAYESDDNIEYIISNSDTEILIVSERLNMHHADITLDILDVTKKRADSGFDYEKCIEGCSEKSEMLIYTSGTTGRPRAYSWYFRISLTWLRVTLAEMQVLPRELKKCILQSQCIMLWDFITGSCP